MRAIGQEVGARATFLVGAAGCVLGIALWSRVSGHGVRESLASRAPVAAIDDDAVEPQVEPMAEPMAEP